jgi:hypothetical protein
MESTIRAGVTESAGARPAARVASRMRQLARPFWIAVALLFLFEAWLWDSLEPVVRRIVGLIPWGRVRPAFIRLVEGLTPRATLAVFAIPFVLLLPVKFLEFWLLAHRQWFAAIAVLLAVKIVGLGFTAFIFEATRDKLLQMEWFARLYEFFMWARDWAHEKTEPVKRQLRVWSRETLDPVIGELRRWRRMLQGRRTGRLFQRVTRIRRRMRAAGESPAS